MRAGWHQTFAGFHQLDPHTSNFVPNHIRQKSRSALLFPSEKNSEVKIKEAQRSDRQTTWLPHRRTGVENEC